MVIFHRSILHRKSASKNPENQFQTIIYLEKIIMKLNTNLLVTFAIFSSLSLGGCVTTTKEVGVMTIKNETQESINKRIHAGKSTKADVIREIGEPTSKDMDDNGSGIERWTYTYFTHQQQPTALALIPFAGMVKHDNSTTARYVIVFFKPNGVVRNINVSNTGFKSTIGFL